jgi:hypothetical protein
MTGAIKTQGSSVAVETALATTKAISGATAANPVVVTATAHGYTAGDIVKIDNVVGMVELNKRAFVVANVTTNSFELKGVDGTSYTAYASGGDSYKATMSAVGYVEGIPQLFSGSAPQIDTTHLKSVRSEQVAGLAPSGTASLAIILSDGDTGQAAMQTAADNQTEKCYTITRSDNKVAAMVAFCTSFELSAPKNEIYRATASLLLRAAPTRFA